MCGRYLLTSAPEALAQLFGFLERPNLPPRYNIAPTQEAPVLRQRRELTGERRLQALRWGLVPPRSPGPKGVKPLINARGETVERQPLFRSAFRRRRCLVPADGFYEWSGTGAARTPYLVSRRDGAPLAFAGIWERWVPAEGVAAGIYLDSFAIITVAANDHLRPLHPRMPAIIAPADFAAWLDPEAEAERLARLLVPAPNALLRYASIGTRVNAVRNDGPDLVTPVGVEVVWG